MSGGRNRYEYVGGDPVTSVDPSGLLFGFNAGECSGDDAASYWAGKLGETGNQLYYGPGLLASLWTPSTSDNTFSVLSAGIAAGGLVEEGFRLKTGSWKQGGEWVAGSQEETVLHFHFGDGPGMTTHHLPYQMMQWLKNFAANIERGKGGADVINAGRVIGGSAGAAAGQLSGSSGCGCR